MLDPPRIGSNGQTSPIARAIRPVVFTLGMVSATSARSGHRLCLETHRPMTPGPDSALIFPTPSLECISGLHDDPGEAPLAPMAAPLGTFGSCPDAPLGPYRERDDELLELAAPACARVAMVPRSRDRPVPGLLPAAAGRAGPRLPGARHAGRGGHRRGDPPASAPRPSPLAGAGSRPGADDGRRLDLGAAGSGVWHRAVPERGGRLLPGWHGHGRAGRAVAGEGPHPRG